MNHESLPRKAKNLAALDIEKLKNLGIKGIVLDLDNTIVSEDDLYLSPHAESWIVQAKMNGIKFFILSNGKRQYRVKYWSARLEIQAICPAQKPFPFSFYRALKYLNLTRKQVVIIGDSFHTDVLGAWLYGCSWIQVETLPHPPRWWENLFGKWVQVPYSNPEELWNFNAIEYRFYS
jgi:uncharacterized protein